MCNCGKAPSYIHNKTLSISSSCVLCVQSCASKLLRDLKLSVIPTRKQKHILKNVLQHFQNRISKMAIFMKNVNFKGKCEDKFGSVFEK